MIQTHKIHEEIEMTKREWYVWVKTNSPNFEKAGLTARQVAILAAAYKNRNAVVDGGKLYLPITLPDGNPAEFGGDEVTDLEEKGLLTVEISDEGARSVKISDAGAKVAEELPLDS